MRRTLIVELKNFINKDVKVQGWVQTIRDQKEVQFIVVRDHTGLIQFVLERSKNAKLAEEVSNLTTESAVTLIGRVVENPIVKLGGFEVQLHDLRVESSASLPLPFDLFGRVQPELDKRLDWRFLDLRQPNNFFIFRVQTTLEMGMREYWYSQGFIEIHSPKLMGSESESRAELFKLEYFGKTAYLAQSPQLYKQMAMAAGFDKIFEIGPVFRANPSFTSRHDTEFTSVDVEISWIDSHEDVMSFEEKWIQHAFSLLKERHGEEIFEKNDVEIKVPSIPFPRITMKEAIEILRKQGYMPPPDKKGDLDPQGERLLCEYVKNNYGHEFVFLKDYPVAVRPFYHMRYENDPLTTKSFDLLWKGLEITTGAQREHRYDVLTKQALEKGLRLEPIQFYLDFFKYGCPPHGGFGFGLTRTLMGLLNLKNVREVTYLYRGPNRLYP
ncbi:MAG: aspartate--tRNA(Asn) ligase [Deltaproteobacteria bacterium CG_4_8_14_3_um_filter_45_9]|nr:MAG: aspartate--tRNA(Asn) ligase [Deltaproteobacteria bacterium CG03_land_8_20_14_0_80_45_14]PIX23735.1 MAG: aspartate--tRNA(Asn) ligase [Deltaproteobacteria bacterium CG_4_8_14_3_um_filter_45_9]